MDLCRDDECAKYFAAFISLQLLIQKGDGIPFLYIFLFDSLENRVNPT